MKKYLMTLAVAICCATTMAQTSIIAIGKYVDRFPKLPPLSADMGIGLFGSRQANLLIPSRSNHIESADTTSIMIRHSGKLFQPHLKFSSVPRMQVNGDPWKATRDRIVRKRRENQGNPLPPPPPRSL